MKENWLKASKQVYGMTKGLPRHNETWWWHSDVETVAAKRKVCHKAWRKSKSAEDKNIFLWKLKDEETARLLTHEMAGRNDDGTKADDIQKKWLLMKET